MWEKFYSSRLIALWIKTVLKMGIVYQDPLHRGCRFWWRHGGLQPQTQTPGSGQTYLPQKVPTTTEGRGCAYTQTLGTKAVLLGSKGKTHAPKVCKPTRTGMHNRVPRLIDQRAGSADQHPWGLQSLGSSSGQILFGQSFVLNSMWSGQGSSLLGPDEDSTLLGHAS